jgi:hypothetical protein
MKLATASSFTSIFAPAAPVHRSSFRPALLLLACLGPALLALLHQSLLGRDSYETAWLLHGTFNVICSSGMGWWCAGHFFSTRASLLTAAALLALFIYSINWTIYAGGCCQTM